MALGCSRSPLLVAFFLGAAACSSSSASSNKAETPSSQSAASSPSPRAAPSNQESPSTEGDSESVVDPITDPSPFDFTMARAYRAVIALEGRYYTRGELDPVDRRLSAAYLELQNDHKCLTNLSCKEEIHSVIAVGGAWLEVAQCQSSCETLVSAFNEARDEFLKGEWVERAKRTPTPPPSQYGLAPPPKAPDPTWDEVNAKILEFAQSIGVKRRSHSERMSVGNRARTLVDELGIYETHPRYNDVWQAVMSFMRSFHRSSECESDCERLHEQFEEARTALIGVVKPRL